MMPDRGHRPEHARGRALFAAFEAFLRESGSEARRLTLREWLDLAEAWRIAQALRDTGGNRTAAARTLGIGRRTLYAKLEKLGFRPDAVRGRAFHAQSPTRPADAPPE